MTVTHYHPRNKVLPLYVQKSHFLMQNTPIKPRMSSIFMNIFFIKSFVIYERMNTFVPAINRSFT